MTSDKVSAGVKVQAVCPKVIQDAAEILEEVFL